MAEYGLHTYGISLAAGSGVQLRAVCREKGWRMRDGTLVIENRNVVSWPHAYEYCAIRGARLPTIAEAVKISEEVYYASVESQPAVYPWIHTSSFAVMRQQGSASMRLNIFEPNSHGLEQLSIILNGEPCTSVNIDDFAKFGCQLNARDLLFLPDQREVWSYNFAFCQYDREGRALFGNAFLRNYCFQVPTKMFSADFLDAKLNSHSFEHAIVVPIICCSNNQNPRINMIATGCRLCEVRGIVCSEYKLGMVGSLSVCSLAGDAGEISIAGGGELSVTDDGGV